MSIGYFLGSQFDSKKLYRLRIDLSKECKYLPYIPRELRDIRLKYQKDTLKKRWITYFAKGEDGKAIGYADSILIQPNEVDNLLQNTWLIQMGVLSEYRAQGIGKHLLDLIVKGIREQHGNEAKIALFVDPENTVALSMYYKYGFKGSPKVDMYSCDDYPPLMLMRLTS